MNYEPWKLLLAKWKTEQPEIIVLVRTNGARLDRELTYPQVGPFIDCMHASLKNGEVDEPPIAQFRSAILEPLQQLLDSVPGTSVVVVPSVRDLVSEHAVFPQAEFASSVFDDPVSVLCSNVVSFSHLDHSPESIFCS